MSDRICSRIPRHSITSDNVSITSDLPILRSTRIARHSRVYSVQQCQQPQLSSIVGSRANRVIAPEAVPMFRAQPHAGFNKIPARSTNRLLDRALIDTENAPTVVGIRLEVNVR